MNKQTIIKAITLLKTNFTNSLKDYTKADLNTLVELWYEMFKQDDEKTFNEAITNIIKKGDYFPTVSQIKKEMANLQTKDLPNAEDEWQEVLKAVHKFGSYKEQEALDSLKPYTAYITRHIGYRNICMAEEQTWNKKEFIGEYETMKDRDIENLQLGNKQDLKLIGG